MTHMHRFIGMIGVLLMIAIAADAADLRATRIMTDTYACDGVQHEYAYTLAVGVSGHPPIADPQIAIHRVWGANYIGVNPPANPVPFANARIVAFKSGLAGQFIFQMTPGQNENDWDFGANGFTLDQSEHITIGYVCWGGAAQTTAVWIFYSVP